MHDQAPHPTSDWPQAPTAGAALLELLTRGLKSAGNRAQIMRSADSRLHIAPETPAPSIRSTQSLSREEAA